MVHLSSDQFVHCERELATQWLYVIIVHNYTVPRTNTQLAHYKHVDMMAIVYDKAGEREYSTMISYYYCKSRENSINPGQQK